MSKQQILVTGANGQLGSELKQLADAYPADFHFIDREELDLTNLDAVSNFFQQQHYDIIINCAAHTAVDKAESEQQLADVLNHQVVAKLAEIAKQQNSTLIHISTDYVFNGMAYRPYQEDHPVDPVNTYGKTKFLGEQAILRQKPNSIIIRTSWVYSSFGANFVKTMLKLAQQRDELGIIADQIGTPTYAADLAQAILALLQHKDFAQKASQQEIYHFSNEGVCSWYDFAKAIFQISQVDCQVNAITTEDYPTAAKRPFYSVMSKQKIKQDFAIQIPYWRDALQSCLQKML